MKNKPTDLKDVSPVPEGEPAVDVPVAEAVVKAPLPPLTPEETEQLQSEAAKAKEHWARLLQTTADFENFKKRVARERHEASRYAFAPLLQKLIPVLDNLDAALVATNTVSAASVQSLQAGIAMIHQQLRQALAEAGLEEIDAANQPFDHHWHEAVSQTPTADVPEGHVLKQLRKGYKLHDRLLRPATVIVAKKPAGDPTPDKAAPEAVQT